MSLKTLTREIELPIERSEAWAFFSDPGNLALITPDNLNFRITSEPNTSTYAGQIISYTVTPFLGLPARWVTEITHVREGEFFVDEQRLGPYKLWHHQHFFESTETGTLVRDKVTYEVGWCILGEFLHAAFIGRRLESIFDYRTEVLRERFGQ